MGTVSRVHTFASGAILTAAQLNNEFDNLLTSSAINGGLDATNLGVTAGQATALKALVVDASRNLADATGSNRINNLALSGTFESTGAITATAGITSGGNIVSDTDSTDDLGTTGVRWANLFVDDITVTNNVTIGGTLTLTGGITLNGNTTIGDSSADTLTVNSTVTSNLIFTDNTYDIGASGATRPRNLYLSGNGVVGGTLGVTGLITATGGVSGALTGDVTGNISGNVTGGTISGTTGTFSGDVAVNTSTLKVDTSNNRVGVKNASPSYPLDIGYTAGINQVAWRGSTNEIGFLTYGSSTDAGAVQLSSGGAAKILFDAAGNSYINTGSNFGINTASPTEELDIQGSGATQTIRLIRTDASTAGGITINSANGSNYVYNTAAKDLVLSADNGATQTKLHSSGDFSVNTSQLFVDQSTARVGINSAAPQGALHIDGTGGASNQTSQLRFSLGGTTEGIFGVASAAGNIISGSTQGDTVIRNDGGNIRFSTDSGSSIAATLDASGNMGLGVTPSGYFADKLVVSAGNADGITIAASATSDVNYFLFADGTSGNAAYRGQILYDHANDKMQLATAATAAVTVDSSQRVGIGAASPATDVHLLTSGSTAQLRVESGLGNYTQLNANGLSNYSTSMDFDSVSHYIYKVSGSEKMRLTSAGLLGLGTASPDGTLHVHTASAGSVTAHGSADDLVVESSADAGLSILTPAANNGRIYFGSPTNNAYGQIDYDHATNDMVFATAGSGKLTISSSGLVGIGTAPEHTLHVKDAADNAVVEVETSATNGNPAFRLKNDAQEWQWQLRGAESDSLVAWDVTGGAGRLYLTTSGNLGLGTASPVALSSQTSLTVNGTSVGRVDVKASGSGGGALFGTSNTLAMEANSGAQIYLNSAVSQPIRFLVNGGDKARITSGGELLVNKTSATGIPGNLGNGTVEVGQIAGQNAIITTGIASGNVALGTSSSASHSYYAGYFYQYNGSAYTGVGYIQVGTSSTSYVTSSDYRLKENVVGITDGITRIKSLKPSRFNFIAEADRTVDGFVAHEVSDIVPEAITGEKDAVDEDGNPEYQGIDQSKLVPLLTAALQEAITKIETLETKVAALEAA